MSEHCPNFLDEESEAPCGEDGYICDDCERRAAVRHGAWERQEEEEAAPKPEAKPMVRR